MTLYTVAIKAPGSERWSLDLSGQLYETPEAAVAASKKLWPQCTHVVVALSAESPTPA